MLDEEIREAKPEESSTDSIDVEEEPLESESESVLSLDDSEDGRELAEVSLKSPSNDILSRIESAESVDELKEFTRLFHLSLAKKEAARALTQSELIDVLLQQADERIRKRPDEMSHKDLLDYLNAFQASVDKSSKTLEAKIEETPPMTLNQTNQEININIGGGKSVAIDDDARMRILDVVNAITKGNDGRKSIQEESADVAVAKIDEGREGQ